MSSNFPTAVDSFINPAYTKLNGIDFVKAEHINDVQDAIRNIQLTIIGSGLSMGLASNNYLPADSDVKTSLEILDAAVWDRETEFNTHVSAVMLTDPIQHHANVIEVTAIGNLSSNKLQTALEEHQVDIDNIMTGGTVNFLTLDDRYLLATGTPALAGSLSMTGDLTVDGDTILGSSLANTVATGGDLSVGRDLTVAGDSEFQGDITMPDISQIGTASSFQYSNLSFGLDFVSLSSIKDIEFKLDSDDAIDAVSQVGEFRVLDGSGSNIFSLLEDGDLTITGSINTPVFSVDTQIEIGTTEKLIIDNESASTQRGSFLVQVDNDNDSASDFFVVTQNGDDGTVDNSTDLLIKVKEDEFIAGSHVQKRMVPETGYFGIKFYSDNAGGRFQGYGVNFKSKMLTAPSSVTLTVDGGASTNYNNLSVTDINEYGFFVECDSIAIGNCEVKGTYETVGN